MDLLLQLQEDTTWSYDSQLQLITIIVMFLTVWNTIGVQRGGDILYCWVCGEDGGEKDPLYAMYNSSKNDQRKHSRFICDMENE